MTDTLISIPRRSFIVGAAGLVAIAGTSNAIAKQKANIVTVSSRADGLSQSGALFTRYGKLAIPAGGRVMPLFQVELITKSGKRVVDRKYHANATATSTFQVEGIDAVAVQRVVDTLYQTFISDLTAAGYQIVSPAEAEASEAWRKLKASVKPSPFTSETGDDGSSIFFGPSEAGVYVGAGDERLMDSGIAGIASFGNVASQASSEFYATKELQAALLSLELSVAFVDISTSGGGKFSNIFGTGEASVKGKALMQIVPDRSRLWFHQYPGADKGKQELALEAVVHPASNPVTDTRDITSRASKLGDAAGTALGILTGTGGSYSTKTFEVTVDPQALSTALDASLSGISAAAVKELTELPSAAPGKKR